MALYQVDEAAIREDNEQLRKGTWVDEEDERLAYYVQFMGDKKWDSLAKASGLRRSGKSCRLRWLNYLRPNIKHGHISVEEENIILQLHQKWGNKWSKIAQQLPGRTDNEIKNFWRTHLRRKGVQAREIVVLEKAKEELLCQDKIESSNYKKYDDNYEAYHNDHEHRNSSIDELLGTSWDNSSEASAVSPDFAFTNSPYENRFTDWISEYSNNKQNESVESSFSSSHLQFWNSGLEYSDSWECSWSLWNMN